MPLAGGGFVSFVFIYTWMTMGESIPVQASQHVHPETSFACYTTAQYPMQTGGSKLGRIPLWQTYQESVG